MPKINIVKSGVGNIGSIVRVLMILIINIKLLIVLRIFQIQKN